MLDWEWYDDINVKCLYLHCLMRANHKQKNWRGVSIEPGQFITSRDTLATELRLSPMQIRTALDKLRSTGEITIKATNKFSMISISKWDEYQVDNQQDDSQITSKQPTNNQQITTNKNDKNDKNKDIGIKPAAKKRKVFVKPTIDEIKFRFAEMDYQSSIEECEKFYLYYDSNGWKVGRNKMNNWKSAFSGWIKRAKEYETNRTNNQQSSAQRVSEKLDSIAAEDIKKNGFTSSLDNGTV